MEVSTMFYIYIYCHGQNGCINLRVLKWYTAESAQDNIFQTFSLPLINRSDLLRSKAQAIKDMFFFYIFHNLNLKS